MDRSGSTGSLYVCLIPPRPVAGTLAVPGGVAADRLHVTVVYVGRLDRLDPEDPPRVRAVAGAVAADHPPVDVSVGGGGRFTAEGRGRRAVSYAVVEGPGLTGLRVRLVDALDGSGLAVDGRPFVPHLTLRYDRPGTDPVPPRPTVRFKARELWVVAGPDRWSLALAGTGGGGPSSVDPVPQRQQDRG